MKTKREGNREMEEGKGLVAIRINGDTYSIRATGHALLRMKQREVDAYFVSGTILSLGKDKLLEYQRRGVDVVIIDKTRRVSIVFGFRKNKINIITVIDKGDVWVRNENEIVRIGESK